MGRSAGSAGGGGYNFQAAATALACAHVFVGEPLNWPEGRPLIPLAVEAETGGPGDDLKIACQGGAVIEVQVKKGLSRGTRLWDALLALVRGLEQDDNLYGVLLVNSDSSGPVKNDLREDIPRLAHGRKDYLKEITREFARRLDEAGVEDVLALRRLSVRVRDLYEGSEGHAHALGLLRGAVDHPTRAWRDLVRDGHQLIEERGRRDVEALRRLVGVSWTTGPLPPTGLRLAVTTDDLRPGDLGFQVVEGNESPDWRRRPFYHAYVPRAMSVKPPPGQAIVSFDEEDLARKLASCEGFVLLGQPLDGKSRTTHEVLKKIPNRLVVSPAAGAGVPEEDALAELVRDREVILLLEDFNDYLVRGYPLRDLTDALERHAAGWVAAATCRDGPEMAAIRGAQGTDLGRFYEVAFPLKLTLNPLAADEKRDLATSLGKTWDQSEAEMYPTVGTIVMDEALVAMRQRFDHALTNDQRDALRALRLLIFGGVVPFTHERLRAVLASPELFDRNDLHLRDCLLALADNSFIRRPAYQDPVDPDPAYLLWAVEYVEGKNPWEDFALLADVLDGSADADGLVYLAHAHDFLFGNGAEARVCLEKALAHKPDFPRAWNNLGTVLKADGLLEEAIDCYVRALVLEPDYLYARYNLGIAYGEAGRHHDAARCLRLVVDRGYAREDEAWVALSTALSHVGGIEEALDAVDRALSLNSEYPEALHQKGVLLDTAAHPCESLQAFDEALKLRPNFAEAWYGKGVVYTGQDEHRKAVAAYRRAVRLDPLYSAAWNNLSAELILSRDFEESLAAADKAMETRLARPSAWYHKGRALTKLGRFGEAVAAIEEAMRRGFDTPEAWLAKGLALQGQGYFHEGARWIYRKYRTSFSRVV